MIRDLRINAHSISGRGKDFFGVGTKKSGGRSGLQRTDNPERSEGSGGQERESESESTDSGNLEDGVDAVDFALGDDVFELGEGVRGDELVSQGCITFIIMPDNPMSEWPKYYRMVETKHHFAEYERM